MKFDLIITMYNSGDEDFKHRCSNLVRAVASIPNNIHIIFIEQTWGNMESFFDNVKGRISHTNYTEKKLKLDKPFNKAWLYNYAVVNLAKTDNFIFGETDVLFPENYFIELAEYINQNNRTWCMGWNKVLYLREDYNNGDEGGVFKGAYETRLGGDGCWGMSLYISKKKFIEIGGYNEYISGASFVDNDIGARLTINEKEVFKAPFILHHLYHKRNYSTHTWGRQIGPENKDRREFLHKNADVLLALTQTNFKFFGSEDGPLIYRKPHEIMQYI